MMNLSRRGLLPLGTALMASPARAQMGAPALPCATAPAFTTLRLQGSGAPAGTVTVFAHPFRPGDVPQGRGIVARAGSTVLAAQCDVLNRHPDGSARLCLVSLACPALAAGRNLDVALSAGPAESERLDLFQALAGRQAVVEITGGAPWRVDLLEALRAATAPAWQSGPLVMQTRVAVRVPQATAGAASLRLVADLSVRRDGTLWVDLWFRNDLAMQPGGGAVAYGAAASLDGREVLRVGSLRQAQYTAWGRLFGGAKGAAAPPPPLVRHEVGYLADTGAVPRYNTALGVEDRLLSGYASGMAEAAWNVPLNPRYVSQNMPGTGDREDIGIATMSQVTWLVTGDRRAAAYAIGQAEASGSVPWHMWDQRAGGGNGGWLDVRQWPRLWTDGRGGPPPGGLQQPVPNDTGWELDGAHQPDLSFVPLLMTGRRAFLDNLQAQAGWNVVAHWPAPRGNGEGLIVRGNQVRGAAWGMRTLINAAWASPDGDPFSSYLREMVRNNWRWIRAQTPEWTARQGEAHGWLPGEYGVGGALPPWQQDHFASVTAIAAQRGDADARAVLDWMSNFIAGRFLARDRGFDPHDGAAYLIAISPDGAPERPYSTWSALGAATRARGMSNAGGWSKSEGNYPQLALASLAALVDATGSDAARRAYTWLSQANAPFTRREDYVRGPKLSVVPRAAGRGAGCAT